MSVLRAMMRESLRGLNLALYLHRVAEAHRPTDRVPGLTIKGSSLDVVLGELSALAPITQTTVTFDDGYKDAADYVDTRAPRFSSLRFLFNVCPQKAEQRAGFRWDLHEHLRGTGGHAPDNVDQFLRENADVANENAREELKGLADREPFRLATVDEVKALARHSNVSLGNHSNCHFPLCRLNDEDLQRELESSKRDFERHFGPMRHFAFPFGFPGVHFGRREITLLRNLGAERIWSTKESPYASQGQTPGAVLPRVQLLGTWSVKHMLLWITQRATVYRFRRARRVEHGDFPL